ncbi:hypothetical protein G6F56_012820 [Rhizopus delemar]|nr:hypothetical protein G6F56_012820 [Rhizopus delemar]
MDCEFNTTSDILFPTDLPKLSSPLGDKVPEVFDWATQDFMYSFSKSANDLNHFLSFQRFVPVHEETKEEKELVQQISRQLHLENSELHDILKGLSLLVQGSLKKPSLSWAADETKDTQSVTDSDITQVEESVEKIQKKSLFYKVKSSTRKIFQKLLV